MGLDTITATSGHELTIPSPCYKRYKKSSAHSRCTEENLDVQKWRWQISTLVAFWTFRRRVCRFVISHVFMHFLTLAGIADQRPAVLRNSESGLWLHTKRWACPGRRQENRWRGSRGLLRWWATRIFKTKKMALYGENAQDTSNRAAESLVILNQICKVYRIPFRLRHTM